MNVTPSRPLYIAVEGIDGAGKSTQVPRLAAWLQQATEAP